MAKGLLACLLSAAILVSLLSSACHARLTVRVDGIGSTVSLNSSHANSSNSDNHPSSHDTDMDDGTNSSLSAPRRQAWEDVLLGEAVLCPEFIPLPPCAFYFGGVGPGNVPILSIPLVSNTALLSTASNGDHPVTLNIVTDISGAPAGSSWWGALLHAIVGRGKGTPYAVEVDAVGPPLLSNCEAAVHTSQAADQFYATGEVRERLMRPIHEAPEGVENKSDLCPS